MTLLACLFPINHFRGQLRATAIEEKKRDQPGCFCDSPKTRLIHPKRER